jgi:hypothetical protein
MIELRESVLPCKIIDVSIDGAGLAAQDTRRRCQSFSRSYCLPASASFVAASGEAQSALALPFANCGSFRTLGYSLAPLSLDENTPEVFALIED